jgi:DNA-binding NarL/FixJ family response regulator
MVFAERPMDGIVLTQSGIVKTVVVCDTQPLAIEGLRSILADSRELKFAGAMTTLAGGVELIRGISPSVAILDRGFGSIGIFEALSRLRAVTNTAAVVVWGVGLGNAEALRLVQAGARGVLRKTADANCVLQCLRAVAEGGTWMEDSALADERPGGLPKSRLTAREHEVAELVEKGLKNREIARSLGIQTGTVKIHLKHIFEKTGCRGRYGLALTGLREKGYLPLAPP